ncbi:MAG TPA: uroporphyrinogen decarboxylase family protein [Bryobacteraceae bacterium]|nr:uroporphyrinogen decarboxylase family protein [Bryobacteraceae bacterium]
MNGYQRIAAVLGGKPPDRVPVMLHNFLMAAREAGVCMREYRRSPRAIARCFIESVERYGYDGVVVDVDTATLAGAVGVPVDYPDDAPARCSGEGKIGSLEEVADLTPPNLQKDAGIETWLEATAILKRHFGDEVYIRGNCDQAPYSLAASMRSPEEWMMDLMDEANHERAHKLLAWCTGAVSEFIRLMAATGAHMVSNGDSWGSPDLVSPRLYREFALPHEKSVVSAAHVAGKPYFLHICGKTDRILPDMVSTGADGLEIDYKTDVRLAHDTLRSTTVFIGNLDPSGVLANGTAALVEEKTRELLRVFSDTPRFILNAGCAIPADTPPDNIKAMIQTAREHRPM